MLTLRPLPARPSPLSPGSFSGGSHFLEEAPLLHAWLLLGHSAPRAPLCTPDPALHPGPRSEPWTPLCAPARLSAPAPLSARSRSASWPRSAPGPRGLTVLALLQPGGLPGVRQSLSLLRRLDNTVLLSPVWSCLAPPRPSVSSL